jgi:hypothetical protein
MNNQELTGLVGVRFDELKATNDKLNVERLQVLKLLTSNMPAEKLLGKIKKVYLGGNNGR